MKPKKSVRMANFTKAQREIAKSILIQYNSLKTVKHGGVRMSQENNATAHKSFVTTTGRQIDRERWRKLCADLRSEEAKRASSPSTSSAIMSQSSSFDYGIGGKQRGEEKAAAAEKVVIEPDGDPLHNVEGNVYEDTTNYEVTQNVTYDNEDTSSKEMNMDHQQLSDTLEDLNLQLITIGVWILVQRVTFDIYVKEEPYHSVQIYANLKTMKYVRRVWGISERRGELKRMDDLRDLCIATFNKSTVCSGHIGPDSGRDLDLVEVKYPFTRWISDSCCIRYSKDQCDEIIGLCTACSGGAANNISINKEMDEKRTQPYEFLTEEDIKYESEEVLEDMNNSTYQGCFTRSEKEDVDNWTESCESESKINMAEDLKEVSMDDNENDVDPILNVEVGFNNLEKQEEMSKTTSDTENGRGTMKSKQTRRMAKITKEQKGVALTILAKYNSLKAVQHGGERLSIENNAAAHETYVASTGHQINRNQWRKITQSLRMEQASSSSTVPKYDHDQVINYDLDDALLAIGKKHGEISKTPIDNVNSIVKEDIEGHCQESNEGVKNNKIGRMASITKEMREVAITILAKYNSLKAVQHGGERLSMENNAAAHETFVAKTGHQIDRNQWRKITQRLRMDEASSSSTVPKSTSGRGTYKRKEVLTCDKCGLTYSGTSSLRHHMETKHRSYADREYKCPFPGCKQAFVSAGSLKIHKPSHGERNFVCDHCGASFWSRGHLTYHLRSKHKALPELKLKCKHCEEIFPCYTKRMWHSNLIHFPERYKCSICQKTFASDYLLTHHTKVSHHDGNFIQCQECGKQLTTEFGLRSHMRLHKGELVSCSHCPWKSHIPSKLYKHMRTQHKEEWKEEQEKNKDFIKCLECGKIVVGKAALTIHRVKVHGQKPTTCVP